MTLFKPRARGPHAVTDKTLPTVQVGTIIPRELYVVLEDRARASGQTKSSYLRKLIEEDLSREIAE